MASRSTRQHSSLAHFYCTHVVIRSLSFCTFLLVVSLTHAQMQVQEVHVDQPGRSCSNAVPLQSMKPVRTGGGLIAYVPDSSPRPLGRTGCCHTWLANLGHLGSNKQWRHVLVNDTRGSQLDLHGLCELTHVGLQVCHIQSDTAGMYLRCT